MQLREETNFFLDQAEFNREEIENMNFFLGTLEKPTSLGTCSLACLGTISQSFTLRVLNMPTIRSWIIDFGAIDHMTKFSHGFVSYNSYLSNKRISTTYGTMITVVG